MELKAVPEVGIKVTCIPAPAPLHEKIHTHWWKHKALILGFHQLEALRDQVHLNSAILWCLHFYSISEKSLSNSANIEMTQSS